MMHKQSEQIEKYKILVTGTAGFIGYHLATKLLELGYVISTYVDTNDLIKDFNYQPNDGIDEFIEGYRGLFYIEVN